MCILGMAGSLRCGSYNQPALRASQSLASDGVKIDIFQLDGIPIFNQDLER